MNPTQDATRQIADIIQKRNSGLIILPQNPTVDGIASATALYLGLSKLGKNLSIVCTSPVKSDLAAADKIQTNFATGGDNLVISFPYTEGAVDKVEYGGNEGNFFNIIVVPHAGAAKLDPQKVQYSYTGGKIDFIITIDAPNFRSLGQIYSDNQQEFNGKTIINIDRHLVNDMYGMVNFVQKTSSSTSELILKILQSLQVELDREMATNLYAGLAIATANFTSYAVNAGTFETAALLLKLGAVKKPLRPAAGMGINQPPMSFPSIPGMPADMRSSLPPIQSPLPRRQPSAGFPTSPIRGEQTTPLEDIEDEPDDQEDMSSAPQDWLKPKIFKGGGLI